MPPRAQRRPISKAEAAAYGLLLAGARPRPKAGDTCTLKGKQVYILAVDGDLAKVFFLDDQHTATCHMDLLKRI